MADLEDKYLADQLTPEELQQLRKDVALQTDREVGDVMQRRWLGAHFEDRFEASDGLMADVKHTLMSQLHHDIGLQRSSWRTHIWAVAAIALILLLAGTTWYFYQLGSAALSQSVVVATGGGEHAHVALPDGTLLELNGNSRVSYAPQDFNQGRRHVSLVGEAYVKVAKDATHPFKLTTEKAQVVVLGTTFNLAAYPQSDITELSLEEGSVNFTSLQTNTYVSLKAGQKVTMDNLSGSMKTYNLKTDVVDAGLWRQGVIVFRNAPLSEVLDKVEEVFSVEVITKVPDYADDVLTGVVSNRNINDILDVIRKTYHLRVVKQGQKVIISKD
uniref:FecR domain-containing protein n=2 Tax=unclassified Prevotella TaxID=2638335 RepID=A0AB33JCK2_9BACT